MKKNILSLSGGKDSTCLLLKMLDKKIKIDEVIYINTTKEFYEITENIKTLNENILKPNNIKFTELTFNFDYWFYEHIKTKGKNKGLRGYGFPSFKIRWCTGLKIKTFNDYIKKKYKKDNINIFIGFNASEIKRSKKFNRNIYKFPLIDDYITSIEALNICYRNNIYFSGIYKYFKRVSCWCCPLKSLKELRNIYIYYPKIWERLEKMQDIAFNSFRNDYSIYDLTKKFKSENQILLRL